MKPYKAVLSIVIQNDGFLSVKHECPSDQLPAMLGAMEMSKDRLKDEINEVYRHPTNTGITSYTKKVSKKEAFETYVEMGKKIQKRLQSINEADDRAVFEVIETSLLNKL